MKFRREPHKYRTTLIFYVDAYPGKNILPEKKAMLYELYIALSPFNRMQGIDRGFNTASMEYLDVTKHIYRGEFVSLGYVQTLEDTDNGPVIYFSIDLIGYNDSLVYLFHKLIHDKYDDMIKMDYETCCLTKDLYESNVKIEDESTRKCMIYINLCMQDPEEKKIIDKYFSEDDIDDDIYIRTTTHRRDIGYTLAPYLRCMSILKYDELPDEIKENILFIKSVSVEEHIRPHIESGEDDEV